MEVGKQQNTEMDKTVIIDGTDTVPIKRRLGYFSGVALIVGSIIGSGIFVSPKGILAHTGSVGASLVVWCVCGFISMLAALVFAELGTLIPKSGGDFTYILTVFGRFPAFMFLWSQLLAGSSSQIILGLTVAEYMSKAIFDDCGPTFIFKQLVAAAVITTSGVSNCISVGIGKGTQVIFTTIKFLGLTVIVIGGFVVLGKGTYGRLSTGFDGTIEDPLVWVTAFYSGMWAYGGWSNLNFVIEEVQNPKRNLPLCIITSMVLVTIIYLLVNISYLSVLTKEEFLSSWATGVTWVQYVIPQAVVLIPIVVACSVYGTLNGSSFVLARIYFAGAREGLFPEILCYLNVHNSVPVPAITTLLALAFIVMIPADLSKMLNLIGFISWIFDGGVMVIHIILHFRMKDEERPLKVPIIAPIIVISFVLYMLISPFLNPVKIEFWYALVFLLTGAVLYFPFVQFKLRIPGLDIFTRFVQTLLNVAPPQEYIPENRS